MQPSPSIPQSKRGEDGWPGERVPAPSDAEIAYQALDPTLVSVFKQAMLADRQAREEGQFPSLENAQTLLCQPDPLHVLAWPTAFFAASLPPPHSSGLDEFVQTCYHRFLCKTPFLRNIPSLDFIRAPRPEYLTLALASMGASMLEQREEQSLQLWQVSASQLVGTMDVDNSVARKADLVRAWTLLETFAFLSSDRSVRRRARMIHGCVKTAVWRILRDAPYFDDLGTDVLAENTRTYRGRSLISYFLLIELLRGIQQGQSTSFPTALLLRRGYPSDAGSAIRTEIPVTTPVDENPDDSLIAILSLLADIHLVTHTFGPLAIQASHIHDTTWLSTRRAVNVPFTPRHEIHQLRQRLSKSLLKWKCTYSESAPKDLLILYHFSQLYNLVPSLQSLYKVVGFAHAFSGSSARERERDEASQALPTYRAAMSTVWLVLEASELLRSDELPIWAPLSVFSAALIVWARREFSKDEEVDLSRARSLYPFQQELGRMKFAVAREMTAILSSLTHEILPLV